MTKAISAKKRGEIKAYPIEIGKPSHGGIRRISLPTNMGRGGLLSSSWLASLSMSLGGCIHQGIYLEQSTTTAIFTIFEAICEAAHFSVGDIYASEK